jgi:hypothetical protein
MFDKIKIKSNLLIVCMVIIIILLPYLHFLNHRLQIKSEESDSYEALYSQSQDSVKTWKNKAGHYMLQSTEVRIQSKKVFDLVTKNDVDLKEMKVNYKKLESLSKTVTETNIHLKEKLKDTLTKDSIPIKTFKKETPYYTVTGEIKGDSVEEHIENRDSIITVGEDLTKRILGIRISKPHYTILLLSKNPNTKLIYNKQITFTRKKRRN